jgi:hypothetical protein
MSAAIDHYPVIAPPEIAAPLSFSLAETCAPVMWGKGRWPGTDWIDDAFVWAGWEGDRVVFREVRQPRPGQLCISGDRDAGQDKEWLDRVLGPDRTQPVIGDPVVNAIAAQHPGMRAFSGGSLFSSIVGCIAGQSISIAAAAVTEARICALAHPGVEYKGRRFWPPAPAAALAALTPTDLRATGVTWRRAEAIVAAAQAEIAGELPTDANARADPDAARLALRRLPLVGEWTAESALLWGLGIDDAFPPNDAALLRTARLVYGRPELDHRQLVQLAEGWRPYRAWAARWIWLEVLGLPVAR